MISPRYILLNCGGAQSIHFACVSSCAGCSCKGMLQHSRWVANNVQTGRASSFSSMRGLGASFPVPWKWVCRRGLELASIVQLSPASSFSCLRGLRACFPVPWKWVCRRGLARLGIDSYGSLRSHFGSRIGQYKIRVSLH